jgi:23S rRNA pseudouridine1911/1915/1917 synthase
MQEVRRLTFEHGRPPERLDLFLAAGFSELSRSQLKRLIDEGQILLDGIPAKAGTRLKGGEVLTVSIPAPSPAEALPEPIHLNIVYEDRHLIVIDKPAGMVVHPAPGHRGGTLVNALLHHCHDLSGIGGELRPGIVHRLDKDTSGLLVATKDDETHRHLSLQFKAHSIRRRYFALVHGLPPGETGTVDRPIGRHPLHRQKMSSAARAGRHAITHWRVLRRFDRDRLTLLELRLETGRTHQIRVHLAEMNLPVVGDPVYGAPGRLRDMADTALRALLQRLERQFLHARLLGFIHPATEEYMEFTSALPADLAGIVQYLEEKYRQ